MSSSASTVPRPVSTADRADIIAACKRARWETTDVDAPEFGGLIEPHSVNRRGLMPEPFRNDAGDTHRAQMTDDAERADGRVPAHSDSRDD